MAVIRIIPAGDLAIEGGDVVVLGKTPETRVQYMRQKIASRFKFFLKEWFLDEREGVPYYRDVFVKNPNQGLIRSLFLKLLRETPGVLDVPEFRISFDQAARTCGFDFQAIVTDGEVVVTAEDEDFLLNLASAA
jgi:hypothetical protein